jgi:hypothetical protein
MTAVNFSIDRGNVFRLLRLSGMWRNGLTKVNFFGVYFHYRRSRPLEWGSRTESGKASMFLPHDVALFAAALLLVVADRVPTFNVEPFCRAVAQRAAPVADVDVCLRKEQEARDELARQWAQFAAADKSHCLHLATIGGDPTYTALLTCLELQRDARMLRQQERETQGRR